MCIKIVNVLLHLISGDSGQPGVVTDWLRNAGVTVSEESNEPTGI